MIVSYLIGLNNRGDMLALVMGHVKHRVVSDL